MKLAGLKWSFAVLSVASVVVAVYLMLTVNHHVQQLIDVASIRAGNTIINPDVQEYEGDMLSWRLQAATAHEQESVLVLKNPTIDLYTEQRESIPIQALDGYYDKEKGYIHLEGDVVVGYQDWILSSDTLDFYQAEDEVHIIEDFILRQEGMEVTGKYMKLMRVTGKIQVLEGVHMVIEEH